MKITHPFVSQKADGTDSTLAKPSDWNADHIAMTDSDGVVLGVPAGAGAGAVQEIPIANVFLPGFIWAYAGSTAPSGWLLCDGSLLNRADQPALFGAIGTTYNTGGETTAQFRLPDLRGRTVAGVDGGAGRLPGWVLGTAGGTLQVQVRCYGNVSTSVSVGGTLTGSVTAESGSGLQFGGGGTFVQVNDAVQVNGSLGGSGSGSIVNNGNNVTDAFDVVQPTITINYLIKT